MASPLDKKDILTKIDNGELKVKPKKVRAKKVRPSKEKIPKIPKQSKRPIIGDPAITRECSVCHEIKPLTSQHFWIYHDLRKGASIEANLYWQGPKTSKESKTIGCKSCYKAYRKKLVKKSKTPKPEAA